MILRHAFSLAAGLALCTWLGLAAKADPDDYALATKGRALATAGDCVACHSAPGQPAYSGGRALETPFGIIKSANLTPDGESGIGRWTPDDFYRAMHEGKRVDGTRLYPAFPYPYYTKVTRADSDAIFAYLQKLEPVRNVVDRNTLPFPFNVRAVMIGWNMLFFAPGTFRADAGRSAEYNRGAYLTEGLGHCGACHTPMNTFGASKMDQAYAGNQIQNWAAPNITNDARIGIGGWSVDDIVMYLKQGHNAQAAASGPMAEVVTNSTALMPQADLHAIAVYLKERNVPASSAPSAVAADDSHMRAGAAVFADTCKACHMSNGAGIDFLFPRLAQSPGVQQIDPANLIRAVVQGTKAVSTAAAPTGPAMPALGWRLSDDQVADVLTYVRNAWGNAAPPVSAGLVHDMRSKF